MCTSSLPYVNLLWAYFSESTFIKLWHTAQKTECRRQPLLWAGISVRLELGFNNKWKNRRDGFAYNDVLVFFKWVTPLYFFLNCISHVHKTAEFTVFYIWTCTVSSLAVFWLDGAEPLMSLMLRLPASVLGKHWFPWLFYLKVVSMGFSFWVGQPIWHIFLSDQT